MRKSILTILAIALAVFTLRALTPEEILGTWESKQVPVETEEAGLNLKVQNKYTFDENGKCAFKSSATMTIDLGDQMFADLFMVVTGNGDYTVAGDSISIVMDKSTVKANMSEDDLRVRGVPDPDMALTMQSQLYQYLAPNMTAMQQNMDDAVLKNVVVGPKKMTCLEDSVEFTYMRRKK